MLHSHSLRLNYYSAFMLWNTTYKFGQIFQFYNIFTDFHMGMYMYVKKQAIKSVSQIKRMNNLQSIICLTQSLAN